MGKELDEMTPNSPGALKGKEYQFDSFADGSVLLEKKKGHLPPMGWNSWNAFGSGNTEALTKAMADKIVELGLDKLGYEYVVLDDGCYKPERVDGKITNEELKFPSGFKALSDYIHGKGLKFGMYNDIGTNLCAGAAVGTCGHEMTDAASYIEWGVDFLKVDNCYYLWDNATFSDAANARFVYAPLIKSIKIKGNGFEKCLSAVKDGKITGERAVKNDTYVSYIGTFDGTGPEFTPVGDRSSELVFELDVPENGEYELSVEYASGKEEGIGQWLQVAVGKGAESALFFDDLLPETEGPEEFAVSEPLKIKLSKGGNILRLMNHRRQENTLNSYAAMLEGLKAAAPEKDVILSVCEWGKTQPQNWAYKVSDSWRILNDITFKVGADGDPGKGTWKDDYTPSVTSQYNKCVIMDEFSGFDKGWNDPDMLMVGMNGMTPVMSRTHFTMWAMMNAPLMLGLDLRRVEKGDEFYSIIANKDIIDLNRDSLGIQAKRIFSTGIGTGRPDQVYTRDNERIDVLAKPLSDGSVALSFFNLSEEASDQSVSVSVSDIAGYIGKKMPDCEKFSKAVSFELKDLWTGEVTENTSGVFGVNDLEGCGNVTYKITPHE